MQRSDWTTLVLRGGLIVALAAGLRPRAAAAADETEVGSLTVPAVAFLSHPSGAAEGTGWRLPPNSRSVCGLEFLEDGAYSFILVARATSEGDTPPALEVLLDSRTVYHVTVRTTNWTTLAFTENAEAGMHAVSVIYTAPFPLGAARPDLVIDSLSVASPPKAPAARLVDAAGYRHFRSARLESWPGEAEALIREHRTGRLTVWVADADGNPAPKATVSVRQQRHAFPFGVTLCPRFFAADATNASDRLYRERVAEYFNSAGSGPALAWTVMEAGAHEPVYAPADAVAGWCSSNGIVLRAEDLFCGCETPAWVAALSQQDYLRAADTRAKLIADRYAGRIREYGVLREPLRCPVPGEDSAGAVTRNLFAALRSVDPTAAACVDVGNVLEGELVEGVVEYLQGLKESGVALGGVGIRAVFREEADPFRITAALDELGRLDLPVKLTHVCCEMADEEAAARCLAEVYRTAFAHRSVTGILLEDFSGACDAGEELRAPADFAGTAAGRVYTELVLSNWWTRAEGLTDIVGRYQCSAFFGEHEVEARMPDGRMTNTFIRLLPFEGEGLVTLHLPAVQPAPGPAAPPPEEKPARRRWWEKSKPAETKPPEPKVSDTRAPDTKAPDTRAPDTSPSDIKPPEHEPAAEGVSDQPVPM